MSDFNMPPGVSTNDIPGNRPEDAAEDAFWDELETELRDRHNLDVEDEFWEADYFRVAVVAARELGRRRGYDEALGRS